MTGRTNVSPSEADWKRVGEMLQDRRVELDTRYSNRQLFADERNINYRLAFDVEKGARSNYSRPVLTSMEVAYGLGRGSLMDALNGGDLEAAPGTPPIGRRGLSDDQRHIAVGFREILRGRREETNGGRASG
jgi:hypothetical protein